MCKTRELGTRVGYDTCKRVGCSACHVPRAVRLCSRAVMQIAHLSLAMSPAMTLSTHLSLGVFPAVLRRLVVELRENVAETLGEDVLARGGPLAPLLERRPCRDGLGDT